MAKRFESSFSILQTPLRGVCCRIDSFVSEGGYCRNCRKQKPVQVTTVEELPPFRDTTYPRPSMEADR